MAAGVARNHGFIYARLSFTWEQGMRYRLYVLLVCAVAGTTPACAEIGRIKSSTGAAFIVRGAAQMPAKPGLPLEPQDLLVTKRDGRMAMTFIDNTRFALGPNSKVTVRRFLFDRKTQRGQFDAVVNRGSLAVVSGQIAKSGPDAMKVRTPTTVLGVRGTRFVVNVP
jgi:hypothetical protein